jgi:hypothetical protein
MRPSDKVWLPMILAGEIFEAEMFLEPDGYVVREIKFYRKTAHEFA